MSRVVVMICGLTVLFCGCTSPPKSSPFLITGANHPAPTLTWQQPQARVLPEGDLRWAPEPFAFKVGKVIRYIDYLNGSDANDGASQDAPWKHHPWDSAATGKAAGGSGADTFIFRRGTTYRGVLVAGSSGGEGSPMRLTSDPTWGSGDAVLQSPEPEGPPLQSGRVLPTIVIREQDNISISGLTFRFPSAGTQEPAAADSNLAAIRVIGGCTNISVAGCLFQRLPAAMCATASGKLMDQISFTDNRVEFADREVVRISDDEGGTLRGVQVLRNSIHDAGQRPGTGQAGHCISLVHPQFAEVAGNILARTTGISVTGGDSEEGAKPSPITRLLIHHNKVIDSLWAVPGASGIQTAGDGPFYVYDNIVSPHDSAYAVSDSYKTYAFNNIGFGGHTGSSEPPTTTPSMSRDIAHRSMFANNWYAGPVDPSVSPWVKMFLPWALCNTVGEWNFCRNAGDTNRVRDDSVPGASNSERASGRYDLRGNAFRFASYVPGALENWTDGALTFDGASQYLTLPATESADVARSRRGPDPRGADIGTSSFIIEVYLRANPGHLKGAIVSKMRETGFELKVVEDGGLSLMLRSPYQISTVEQALVLKDGKWHHILVEVDRPAARATFYIDGRFVSSGGPLLKDSLSNRAELWVGRSADNNYFAGDIDFLRICRGTLADAGTSIDELYAWEFDGPQLRDFGGQKR